MRSQFITYPVNLFETLICLPPHSFLQRQCLVRYTRMEMSSGWVLLDSPFPCSSILPSMQALLILWDDPDTLVFAI